MGRSHWALLLAAAACGACASAAEFDLPCLYAGVELRGELVEADPQWFRPCAMEPLTTYEARVSYRGSRLCAARMRAAGGAGARRLLDIDKVVFRTDEDGEAPSGSSVIELWSERVSRPARGAPAEEALAFVLVLEPLLLGVIPPGAIRLATAVVILLVLAFAFLYRPVLRAVTRAPGKEATE